MNRLTQSGLAIAAAILAASLSIPEAQAAPLAVPPAYQAADSGYIVQVVTRAGVAHRSSRRTARRVNRRHSY
jgi:hypothetical protein